MEQFDLKKFLVENKLTTNSKNQVSKNKSRISEGFLDTIAKTITGKSDQGAALEKEIQRVIPGFKNGGYVYTPRALGGTQQKEWEVSSYIEAGGNLDVQFPMPVYSSPQMAKADPYLNIVRQRVKFNFDLEVPTVQSLSEERFSIPKQQFVPVNDDDLIPDEPTPVTPQQMAETEEGHGVTAQIKMVPLVELVKNWPGRAGDYARKVLAKRQQGNK